MNDPSGRPYCCVSWNWRNSLQLYPPPILGWPRTEERLSWFGAWDSNSRRWIKIRCYNRSPSAPLCLFTFLSLQTYDQIRRPVYTALYAPMACPFIPHNIYIYIYIYIYMHSYIYTYTYIWMRVCMYVSIAVALDVLGATNTCRNCGNSVGVEAMHKHF